MDVTFNLERKKDRLTKKQTKTFKPFTLTVYTKHWTIYHKSLNTSLKPSVKDYSEIPQVLKYLSTQTRLQKSTEKNEVTKQNCNIYTQISSKITPEEEHEKSVHHF